MASMNAVIQQILLVFFFLPVTVIDSKNSCPSSSCGDITNPIMYPFKLENEPPQKTCHDYIDLRCYQGQLVINLPSSGDFYVTDIDYYSKKIALSDPGYCLPQRVMTKFSVYPLEVLYYQNYTYYTCTRSVVGKYGMNEIRCLSNSTSATIAVTEFSTGFMERELGCQPTVSSLVPVMTKNGYDYSEIIADLWLTWNASGCKGCDSYGDETKTSGDSSSNKWTKFFSSPIFIPSAVVLAAFFGAACFLRLYELMRHRFTESNNAAGQANNPTATSGSTAATSSATPDGVDNLKAINSCTEILVLSDESQGPSVAGGTHMSCSICLEDCKKRYNQESH